MKRNSMLSFVVVASGIAALLATSANSQLGSPKNYVALQPTTPGTSQSGNANISGTIISGAIQTAAFRLPNGAAANKVLTSSATGVGTWRDDGLTLPYNGYYSGTGNALVISSGTPSNGTSIGALMYGIGSAGLFQIDNPNNPSQCLMATTNGDGEAGRFIIDNSSSYSDALVAITNGTGCPAEFLSSNPSSAAPGLYAKVEGSGSGLSGVSLHRLGKGVDGSAQSPTGPGIGGFFTSSGDAGKGVVGISYSSIGVTYGVFGQTYSSSGAYGVYSNGDLGASGVKSFRIDHPFDPENKYLLHYSAESPTPQNFYVGNVVTDQKGSAWVELPDYFGEININFKYQLTVIDESGEFAQAIISRKIQDGRFQIRTSRPNIEVSWEVKADRNDLYVRNNLRKDVQEKQGLERGTYQHPELYGMPPERGVNFSRERPIQTPVSVNSPLKSRSQPR